MDAEGLDAAVLFPSRGLFVLGLDTDRAGVGAHGLEPGLAAAIARAYNDWLHDFCARDPRDSSAPGSSRRTTSTPPPTRCKRCRRRTYGFKTVFLHPGCVNGVPWHDPDYDPIWRACEELDVPICFHGGGQNYLRPDYTLEVFDNLMMWHTFGQPLGIMAVIVSFTSGGVIQRFPEPARRLARRELRLGAVVAPPPRRALGVDRRRPTRPTSKRRRRSSSGRTASSASKPTSGR